MFVKCAGCIGVSEVETKVIVGSVGCWMARCCNG